MNRRSVLTGIASIALGQLVPDIREASSQDDFTSTWNYMVSNMEWDYERQTVRVGDWYWEPPEEKY